MSLKRIKESLYKNRFLFEELVKRDFKRKYKETTLGVVWSLMSPLLMLLVMSLVFSEILGRNAPHYNTYLFSGNIVMNFYREATKNGMGSLYANRKVIEKINIPKYLYIFSENVLTLNLLVRHREDALQEFLR